MDGDAKEAAGIDTAGTGDAVDGNLDVSVSTPASRTGTGHVPIPIEEDQAADADSVFQTPTGDGNSSVSDLSVEDGGNNGSTGNHVLVVVENGAPTTRPLAVSDAQLMVEFAESPMDDDAAVVISRVESLHESSTEVATSLAPVSDISVSISPSTGNLHLTRGPPPKYRLFVLVFALVFAVILLLNYTTTKWMAEAFRSKERPAFVALITLITVGFTVTMVVFVLLPLAKTIPCIGQWFHAPYHRTWGDSWLQRTMYRVCVG